MNIAIFGAKGRVGKALTDLCRQRRFNVWQIDKDYSKNPLASVDVAIDFSVPSALTEVAEFCLEHHCPLVEGVTGYDQAQQQLLEELSAKLPVVYKQNYCIGVDKLAENCVLLAKALPSWDCEIVEIHRKGKLDSPSGTAKMLAGKIAQARGTFAKVTVHSLRCGSNFGTHTVVFASEGQSITLTHQAENVTVFAQGALDSAISLTARETF